MKVGMLWLLRVVVLMLVLRVSSLSSASYSGKQNGRKSMLPVPAQATTSSLMLNRVGNSVVLPLHGNVYPDGFFDVTLNIGQPSKPYFLDPDTGSDLTWLQCDFKGPCQRFTKAPHPHYKPSNNPVLCGDPLCKSLHPPEYKCETTEQCYYELWFQDGSSTRGVLVKDAFSFNFRDGKQLEHSLALGCGYNQTPGPFPNPNDGVLGLGKGKLSIVSQLSMDGLVRNIIGHCMSVRGGGYLFFGDDHYDSSLVQWISMSSDLPEYYSPGWVELKFGGQPTGIKNLLTVFDSGSSYTYLYPPAYEALITLVEEELIGKSLKQALDDETLPICWKGERPFKSLDDVREYFKPIALSFANDEKDTQFELPPEAYLIISHKENVCLGILNGTAGRNLNIIGDISMQDKVVIYDNEKQRIGWAPEKNCDQLPKSKSTSI
ncbi:hypothetical protein CMV_016253 [Castanea mollissima]|uniref:Aspartic proteinase Asp1 n=1 Tax=Castanea mollissima TaxID=60419 RepID=A0A8J4R6W4_9ROSI|nr:hypothetical protein CMV_016253 [Castanea mollissima]